MFKGNNYVLLDRVFRWREVKIYKCLIFVFILDSNFIRELSNILDI